MPLPKPANPDEDEDKTPGKAKKSKRRAAEEPQETRRHAAEDPARADAVRMPPPPAPLPMPDTVKKVFQEKHGYANYYFNHFEQDRVCKAWRAPATSRALAGTWKIEGKLDSGSGFRLRLTGRRGRSGGPVGDFKWAAGADMTGTAAAARQRRPAARPAPAGAAWPWRAPRVSATSIIWATARCWPDAARARRLANVLVGELPRHRVLVLLRSGQRRAGGLGDVSRRGQPTLARSGSPLIATWTAAACPAAWRSAWPSCVRRVRCRREYDLAGKKEVENAVKHRIPSTKFQTNPKWQVRMFQTERSRSGWRLVSPPGFPSLAFSAIRICLRIGSWGFGIFLLLILATAATAWAAADPGPAGDAVHPGAAARSSKIYGAGGFRGMEHYQSGILISPEGHILTV